MFDVIFYVLLIVISLPIVLKSAELFVDNVVEIGTALELSQILLGVTAAAIGTSLPEFGSALIASLGGNTDLGLGIAIGANIWNIGGILGITAIFTGIIKADKKAIHRDGLMSVITFIILFLSMAYGVFLGDGYIPAFTSIIMIIVYVYYMRVLIKDQKKSIQSSKDIDKDLAESADLKEDIIISSRDEEIMGKGKITEKDKKQISVKNVLFFAVGIIGLGIGCQLLVYGTESLAHIFKIQNMVIMGLILALGTTIPEFAVTISSAMRGLHDLSVGTIFGSMTFNILMGLGVPALILGGIKIMDPLSFYLDVPVMIGLCALSLILIKLNGMKLNRYLGGLLLGIYLLYVFLRLFVLV